VTVLAASSPGVHERGVLDRVAGLALLTICGEMGAVLRQE
jgi:hypothetical protein